MAMGNSKGIVKMLEMIQWVIGRSEVPKNLLVHGMSSTTIETTSYL